MGQGKRRSKRLDYLLYLLLIGVALLAPLVSYAGISLIYPGSQFTSSVVTTPPIRWSTGDDYTKALNLGLASATHPTTTQQALC